MHAELPVGVDVKRPITKKAALELFRSSTLGNARGAARVAAWRGFLAELYATGAISDKQFAMWKRPT